MEGGDALRFTVSLRYLNVSGYFKMKPSWGQMPQMQSMQGALNCTGLNAYTESPHGWIGGIRLRNGTPLVVIEIHFLVCTSLPPDGSSHSLRLYTPAAISFSAHNAPQSWT
jgi:hypothetical protein